MEQKRRLMWAKTIMVSIWQLALALAIVAVVLGLAGCADDTEDKSTAVSSRWMDRKVYLAFSDEDPKRNGYFQKQDLRAALEDISANSMLGAGYFEFEEMDESEMQFVRETQGVSDFKSFIVIWPTDVFNQWAQDNYGGSLVDRNAMLVINAANKRQFYLILRAECFESSVNCDGVGKNGMYALVARQLGRMTGLSVDCTNVQSTMCADSPSNVQWNSVNKFNFIRALDNQLEKILMTPDFYQSFSAGE
nr:hypothetical protein BdHM001_35390 [Bdellovibrio sp. HM001]